MNLAEGFFDNAQRHPERLAFVVDEQPLSYAQLAEDTRRWQSWLRSHIVCTVAKSDPERVRYAQMPAPRVAWCGDNSAVLPAVYLACVSNGYVLVLLDHHWPPDTRQSILKYICPACVLTPSSQPTSATASAGPASDTAIGCDSDPFLIGFTSGSTGGPKSFIRSQHSWLETFARATEEFGSAADKQVLAPGPLSHGLSFYSMAETLNAGGTFYSQSHFDPDRCLQRIASKQVDTLIVVPTMLAALCEAVPTPPTSLRVSQIITAGAKLSPRLRTQVQTRFPACVIHEYYGASELSFVTVAQSEAPAESVGRAFAGVTLSIRDKQGGIVAAGVSGAVCVHSKLLADGYIRQDNTLDHLPAINGWATVGDIGKLDENGYLFLLDRSDSMLITGGLNVSPAEIERVLDQHPLIIDSVVVGMQDDYWGDRVCAVVRLVPASPSVLTLTALRHYCEPYLATHQVPRQLFEIDCWPMTSSGKTARASVRDLAATGDPLLRELHD